MRTTDFRCPVQWGTDSLYALGIMLYGHAASTEVYLVTRARAEAREASARYRLAGEHTPTHIGHPPHECAEVTAILGRTCVDLAEEVAELLQSYRATT